MTAMEWGLVVIYGVILAVVNIRLSLLKTTPYDTPYGWMYFAAVKALVLLSGLLTMMQLYVFTFDYVPYVGSKMHYLVLYQWIGYLLLFGFIAFIEAHQVKLFGFCALLGLLFQGYIGFQLYKHQAVIQWVGSDSPYNLFRYGDTLGVMLCFMGAFLSLLSLMTWLHYFKKCHYDDFTA